MNTNFRIKFKVILLPIFIAFYLPIQVIEADLPNKDLWKAVPCVRKFFGDEFVQELYRNDLNPLTDGEYLAAFCNDFSPENVDETVKTKAEGNYDGADIEKCLADVNSVDLFQNYIKMGKKFADSEVKKPVEEGQSVKSKLFSRALSENSDLESADTSIYYFLDGVCYSKKEVVPFYGLTDANDIKEILECSVKCIGNLIQRLQILLTAGKKEAVKLIQNNKKEFDKPSNTNLPIEEELKLREECDNRIKTLENASKLSVESTKKKFDSDLRIRSTSKSIKDITQVGKEHLIKLGGLYNTLTEYLTEEVEQEDSTLGNLDERLGGVFDLYQNYCSVLGCGMPRYSVPLYEVIESGAKDNESKYYLKQIVNLKETAYEWMKLQPRNWKRFCKVLLGTKSANSETNKRN